jgi:hypothetical protein
LLKILIIPDPTLLLEVPMASAAFPMALMALQLEILSHSVLRPKPDAHRMYAQDQVVIHTARM